MTPTPEALARLGALVAQRRVLLRLDVLPAARLGGTSNKTWAKVEAGKFVRATTYTAIEKALRWRPGSCQAILNGGEPQLLDDAPPETAAAPEPTLLSSDGTMDVWDHPVQASDLREAVRAGAMATMPGATVREVQALERAVEDYLRRILEERDSQGQ